MNDRVASACRFGATRLDTGAVEFRLWAPAQETVSVAIESGGLLPMRRSLDGWFVATAPVPAGTRYHFRLADGLMVPDPASMAQAPDVHDASIVLTDDFAWRHPEWNGRPWAETIIYEVH